MRSKDKRIQQDAATEILDRGLGKPAQTVNNKLSGSLDIMVNWEQGGGDGSDNQG